MAGRLAIFLPSLAGGGAERAMLNLAHGLVGRGQQVDLVLARACGPYLGAVSDQIRLVDLKASRVLASLPRLTQYLRREHPLAVLSALDYANIVSLWARRISGVRCRAVVNEQNTISRSAGQSARRRQRMVPHLVRHFYPWADYVIGNSSGVAADLRRVTGLSDGRVRMLYNPVIMPGLEQRAAESLAHPWFVAGQPPVVLAVGRLTAQKDFATLIRAFGEVRQQREARLLILGEGPDRAMLVGLVRRLDLVDDVALPGFVDNPYAFMSRSALYVLSSRWEGLPTVLIEALFCGPPVVATDCPSGPREILAGGRYGKLVPVADATAVAEAMFAGLSGQIPRPPAESWRPYSLDRVVDQYSELLLNPSGPETVPKRTEEEVYRATIER